MLSEFNLLNDFHFSQSQFMISLWMCMLCYTSVHLPVLILFLSFSNSLQDLFQREIYMTSFVQFSLNGISMWKIEKKMKQKSVFDCSSFERRSAQQNVILNNILLKWDIVNCINSVYEWWQCNKSGFDSDLSDRQMVRNSLNVHIECLHNSFPAIRLSLIFFRHVFNFPKETIAGSC